MPDFTIRPAALADLPAVRTIYNHYVATSTCTYQVEPESEADRLAWFTKRTTAHPVVVAKAGGEVVQKKMAIGPAGFIAVIRDTEGNVVGLHSHT